MTTNTTTRKVEYLRALDDGTWDTFVEDVPNDQTPEDYVHELVQQCQHRRAVLIAVYNENVGEGDE